MHKIAVIGDRESICGFAAVGMDVFPVESTEQAEEKLKQLASDNYAVIFITESLASSLKNQISRYKDEVTPAIILIPGLIGNTGEGMSSVYDSVERAVGSQIL